mmetsp:Transcript_30484/g.85344  ORF Transcript_30484/g.85344 Transcript_30484/m.85344 type:complete len:264 (+) Transcript_30484:837-1628(+)
MPLLSRPAGPRGGRAAPGLPRRGVRARLSPLRRHRRAPGGRLLRRGGPEREPDRQHRPHDPGAEEAAGGRGGGDRGGQQPGGSGPGHAAAHAGLRGHPEHALAAQSDPGVRLGRRGAARGPADVLRPRPRRAARQGARVRAGAGGASAAGAGEPRRPGGAAPEGGGGAVLQRAGEDAGGGAAAGGRGVPSLGHREQQEAAPRPRGLRVRAGGCGVQDRQPHLPHRAGAPRARRVRPVQSHRAPRAPGDGPQPAARPPSAPRGH